MVVVTVTSAKNFFRTIVTVRLDSEVGYISYKGTAAQVKDFLSPILAELVVKEIPYKVKGSTKII